jgi:hypothetical protein
MLSMNTNTLGASAKRRAGVGPWYGFRLIKGQTESLVTEIGSDPTTIANKPVSSTDRVYPAVVTHDGTVQYKLGGSTGNDLTKKSGSAEASNLDGTDGEVGTIFEEFYYTWRKWSDGTNTYIDWKFSIYPNPGWKRFPKFFMGIYPAYYDSGNDILRSISGVTPTNNQQRSWYRQKAANIGSGWCQEPYYQYNILYFLWVAQSLNLNMQESVSVGATNALGGDWTAFCGDYWPVWQTHGGALSSYADAGGVLNVSNPNQADVRTGEIPIEIQNWGDGTKTLNTQMAVAWHVRDYFGHFWRFKDGLNIHNSSANGARAFVSDDPANFADDTESGYELIGNIAESDGYVSEFLEGHMLPTETAGGSSAHVGDYHYTYYDNNPDVGWRGAFAGGSLVNSSYAGPACFVLGNSSSFVTPHLGARLCKIFD